MGTGLTDRSSSSFLQCSRPSDFTTWSDPGSRPLHSGPGHAPTTSSRLNRALLELRSFESKVKSKAPK
eukprot:482675-Pleurochrysis_carterae.AAC.1